MQSISPRISLSIGRDSDGPRTTGDINILGISLSLFQIWLYMAVYNAPLMFNAKDAIFGERSLEMLSFNLHPLLVCAFLITSAVCLMAFAIWARNVPKLLESKPLCMGTTCACVAGTALTALGGNVAPILSGVLMGVGSSAFLMMWGSLYARFRFATSVINASISFALGLIAAIALVNWVPAPASGSIATCLPLTFLTVFWKRRCLDSSASTHIPPKLIVGYYERLVACLVVLGVALGTMRALSAGRLLSANGTTTELLLGAGCIAATVVFIVALALSKKETNWDWLFRAIIPVVVIGIASLPLMTGDIAMLSIFLFALGYICLEVLVWVFLVGVANNVSTIFVFGLGFGTLNFLEAIGTILASSTLQAGLPLFDTGMTDMLTRNNLAMLALLLVVLAVLGYSLLPRYYELKTILSSVLNEMLASERSSDALDTTEATVNAKTDDADPTEASEIEPLASPDSEVSSEITEEAGSVETEARDEKGSFTRRCDEISLKYKLSGREREVLFLLAKGHNASFILDKLCISRSTAKTHINHIYKKLDIHTQQELLNMVEDRKRHVDPKPDKPLTDGIATGAMGAAIKQDPEALKEVVLQAHIQHHI